MTHPPKQTHLGVDANIFPPEIQSLSSRRSERSRPMTHDTTGIQAITAERQRQTEKEGWTPEYDDTHTIGQMARAAACYAWAASLRDGSRRFFDDSPSNWWLTAVIKRLWPWDREWWKPKDRRADLVRAGALIAAEIDRLDRLEEGGGS